MDEHIRSMPPSCLGYENDGDALMMGLLGVGLSDVQDGVYQVPTGLSDHASLDEAVRVAETPEYRQMYEDVGRIVIMVTIVGTICTVDPVAIVVCECMYQGNQYISPICMQFFTSCSDEERSTYALQLQKRAAWLQAQENVILGMLLQGGTTTIQHHAPHSPAVVDLVLSPATQLESLYPQSPSSLMPTREPKDCVSFSMPSNDDEIGLKRMHNSNTLTGFVHKSEARVMP